MEYEIHITVKTNNLERFKNDCDKVGVKLIVIETEKNKEFNNQVMTSSKYKGINYVEVIHQLSSLFCNEGYEIIRKKVEIRPETEKHEDFIYYESHLRLKLPKDFKYEDELRSICYKMNFHLSKNLFKRSEEFNYQMITFRSSEVNYSEFLRKIDEMSIILDDIGVEFDKVEIEECIYDSNESVDKNWI